LPMSTRATSTASVMTAASTMAASTMTNPAHLVKVPFSMFVQRHRHALTQRELPCRLQQRHVPPRWLRQHARC
jgi:hypothetical protein